jgi:SAM-dependent methyltransferase/C-terminal processing protease CtpA/Prc
MTGWDARKLADLCMVWATVKFLHPAVDAAAWDDALLEALPAVRRNGNWRQYRATIDKMLSSLHDPLTRTVPKRPGCHHLGAGRVVPGDPGPRRMQDGGAALIAADYAGFDYDSALPSLLRRQLEEAFTYRYVVLDLRGATWWFNRHLLAEIGQWVHGTVVLPAEAGRLHSGYESEQPDAGGGFYSAVVVKEFEQVEGTAPASRSPLVVVCGERSGLGLRMAAGLSFTGQAFVVFEGRPLPTGSTRRVVGRGDFDVEVRCSHWSLPSGDRVDLEPDVTVAVGSPGKDPAMLAATRLATLVRRPGGETRRLVGPIQRCRRRERVHETLSVEVQLLGLFRLWAVMDRFFPYHDRTETRWREVLERAIPEFVGQVGEPHYSLAVARTVHRLHDTHAQVFSTALAEEVGTHFPSLSVRLVSGRAVVDQGEGTGGPRRGDVIVAIDDSPVERRIAVLSSLLPASTPQAQRRQLQRFLLAGKESIPVQLCVLGPHGEPSVHELRRCRTQPFEGSDDAPILARLRVGVVYVDVRRLRDDLVEEAVALVRASSAAILDLRGYPVTTAARRLAARLATRPRPAARFLRRAVQGLDPAAQGTLSMLEVLEPSAPGSTPPRIVVLVNEDTISRGEHACLLLAAAAPEVVFVGSATSGTCGDISHVKLPGGVTVMFSAHGTAWPDGTPLQRQGIQPHIDASPTLEGIRNGRDEVLGAALAVAEGFVSRQSATVEDLPARRKGHSAPFLGAHRRRWWNEDFMALLARRLELGTVGSMLDIGCGRGDWSDVLLPVVGRRAFLVVLDTEQRWLREARKRLAPRAMACSADAASLCFPNESFDLVTCQTVLMHVPDPGGALEEMTRVTRAGGLVMCAEPVNLFTRVPLELLDYGSVTEEEVVASMHFWLRIERGKKRLGEGDTSIGRRLPGLLASAGLEEVGALWRETTFTLLPPYAGSEEAEILAQERGWKETGTGPWDRGALLRYFVASGGSTEDFNSLFSAMERQFSSREALIADHRYRWMGLGTMVLAWGRKGRGTNQETI